MVLTEQAAHGSTDQSKPQIGGETLVKMSEPRQFEVGVENAVILTTMIKEAKVPAHPRSNIGLRPTRSDTPPQNKPVRDSARAKAEMKMPA